MKNIKKKPGLILVAILMILLTAACGNSSTPASDTEGTGDSLVADSGTTGLTEDSMQTDTSRKKPMVPVVQSSVLVYNFHITNRCASCIAIEEATTKTLQRYFGNEIKQGRIKRYILNVDDEENAALAEKYETYGSGLFVTRVFKGKETTADLTADGFKYARNKEDVFIGILREKITEFLK